jgi:integrase
VPSDLLQHYKQPFITKSTGVKDKISAIGKIAVINKLVEQEWAELRSGTEAGPIYSEVIKLLANKDINAKGKELRPDALGELFDDLKDRFPPDVKEALYQTLLTKGQNEHTQEQEFALMKYLSPNEKRALNIIREGNDLYLSEYADLYADLKGIDKDTKKFKTVQRDLNQVIEFLGDRMPHEYSKLEVNSFIKDRLDTNVKTGTVSRGFNSINAAITKVNDNYEIDHIHRFNNPNIPNMGDDRVERKDFTVEELNLLRSILESSTTRVDQLLKIALDTGMRVSEVAGLKSEDIVLSGDNPYIKLRKNQFRSLKTKNSTRAIPLIGLALNAIQGLDLSQEWLFPSYCDTVKKSIKSDSASAAMNKRIRAILNNKQSQTSHSFRHTMQTRLRNVECPLDIRDEICGWKSSISKNYGSPTDIKIKANYMRETLTNYC